MQQNKSQTKSALGDIENNDAMDIDEINNEHELKSDDKLLCLLYTSPSPRDISGSRMPSSA